MSICKILNKWTLEVPDNYMIAYEGKLAKRPYTHYLKAKQMDIAANVWCFADVMRTVSGCSTVVEYFGGIGTLTTIIQNTLYPTKHVCIELDETCVSILRRNFPDVYVVQDDCYNVAGQYKGDLTVLDPETFTLMNMDALRFNLLRCIFDTGTKYVVWVDTAISKYHLNENAYRRIAECLQHELNGFDTYIHMLSKYYATNFGYHITAYSSHTRATYILLEPGDYNTDIRMSKINTSQSAGNFVLEA